MELASSTYTIGERWAEELFTPEHPVIGTDPLIGYEITEGSSCELSDRLCHIVGDIHSLKLHRESGELPYQHNETITLPMSDAEYTRLAITDFDIPF